MNRKDSKILSYINSGEDEKAIECIYKNEFRKIASLVKKGGGSEDDAKDIFQETIIIFYRQLKLNRYDKTHEIGAYTYTIARNLWINHLKKQKHHERIEHASVIIPYETDVDLFYLTEERERKVQQLFSYLGDMCKQLLTLYYYKNLSLKEIAKRMGYKSETVVKSKKYKCNQFLVEKVKINRGSKEI